MNRSITGSASERNEPIAYGTYPLRLKHGTVRYDVRALLVDTVPVPRSCFGWRSIIVCSSLLDTVQHSTAQHSTIRTITIRY